MSQPTNCPECGATLPEGQPKALCPRCALSSLMASNETSVNPATPASQLGDTIGRYKLLQKIGEGGMGDVWMAEQSEPIRRKVALKVVKLGMDTRSVIARFEAERQALALMDHPNIAKVLDAGATDRGRPYFVMELVRGVRVTTYCDQQKLTTRARLNLFIQVCHAIQHAHQKGIIHRDIKPSNILVTLHDGVPVPKVIDFGIAKATSDQRLTDRTLFTAFEQFMGTPAYMSPEQAEMSGLDIDTRSDIYSLGVLLYELLTGKTPFDAKELLAVGFEEMRRTIREKEPAKPSTRLGTMADADLTTVASHRQTEPGKLTTLLRGDLDWIVMKALEKDRTRRYESASGLAVEILRHLRCEPVAARPPTALYRFQKAVRRNKLAFAASTAIAAVILLGGAVSIWQAVRATRAEHTQSGLRVDAEIARATAQTEAGRAEAAALDAKMTLAASDFSQAVRLIAADNGCDALAFLSRSLSGNPTNNATLTRLATLLTSHSWMWPTLSLKHGGSVSSARFSPDGKRVLTTAADSTARVWDARTGELLLDTIKHGSNGLSAEFSPDGRRIVTASFENTARMWDALTGQPLAEPMKHGGRVLSVQFSPDGRRIVTTSDDRLARVWDAQSGQPLTATMKHSGQLRSAQFSPDGRYIVTAADIAARIWDAQTGRLLAGSMEHGGVASGFSEHGVLSAQFSPDGERIVTAASDRTARVWDSRTGQPLTGPMKHGSSVRFAQFSPDGKRIVTASWDNTARIWDADTGQPVTEPLKHGASVRSARFSPDGRRIVTGSSDNTARIWDADTGQPLTEPMKHFSGVYSAEFSPDGKHVVTASHDEIACVWDTQSGQPLAEPMRHLSFVNSARFSPDGNRIVTASYDDKVRFCTVCVWDAQTGQLLTKPMKHDGMVPSAEFSPSGTNIATASWDHTARVWDARTGEPLTEPLRHGERVFSARFSPDGQRLVTASSDRTARLWDARTGQPLAEPIKHYGIVSSAEFSPDGKRIVTASDDGNARVWDSQSGQPLTAAMKHDWGVRSAQFSPDGKRIVTASGDRAARVWDAQTGLPLTEPVNHDGSAQFAKFSPDGECIVTAGADNSARVWNAHTGQLMAEPMRHGDVVFFAEFSPDGGRIVTASADTTARVWDTRTGQPLTEPFKLGKPVTSAQFSPDGKRIVTASYYDKTDPEEYDYTARVWDVAPSHLPYPDWLLPLSEAISGRVLNKQGLLEHTTLNVSEVLNQIRHRLREAPDDNDWVVWGRWFLADRATRAISPFSKITVPEYIQNRIKEGTLLSLDEADRLAVGNPELLRRISEVRSQSGRRQ